MVDKTEYEQGWDKYIAQTSLDDGLENVLTGLGTSSDKSVANRWVRSGKNLDVHQLAARYREDWISQKVCTIVPDDTTREWRDITTDDGVEADALLGIKDLFCDAATWARLYGTSFIVLDIKGSGSLDKPINTKNLKVGCINNMFVVDRTRVMPMGAVNYDPMSPSYGLPLHYQLVGSTEQIHYSRLLRFDGTRLPLFEQWNNQWFSDSTLIPLEDVIDQFHSAAASASSLCQEALVDVVSIPNLQSILSNPMGEAAIMKRFRNMKLMKSVHNVLLLDSNEEYDTKAMNLNAMKELIWEYLKIVAAACSIPATRFLSASPDGMNATGESDLINYIQMLQGYQRRKYSPILKQLDPIIQAHFGIEEYSYKWNCIFPESASQATSRKKETVETLTTAIEKRLLSIVEARKEAVKQGIYEDIDPNKEPPIPELTPQPVTAPQGNKEF